MAINEKARRILDHIGRTEKTIKQGRLKIFLGMVAGVGKTSAMLSAAKSLKENGTHVVVGYIETHGRKETENMLKGLPILPTKSITYKGKIFQEMDLDGIIALHPEIVLVDEFAHTNVPGSLHEKRYQDVLDILGQGIDVYTSLNVQHVESCAGLIQNITGIIISETLPDTLLDIASEIVLIDLDPDQIIERLKAGKIYPQEKVQSSLENYFKKSNLIALRETVLRLLADRVNVELRDLKVVHGIPQIWKTSFRILVPILSSTEGEYLIRMTRRMASGLNARWIAAQVEETLNNNSEESNSIRKNALLAKQLGADVISILDTNYIDGLSRIIREYQVTHLIVARTHKKTLKQFNILSSYFPDLDIVFLSTNKSNIKLKNSSFFSIDLKNLWSWKNVIVSFSVLAVLTLILKFSLKSYEYQVAGMIYLFFLCLNSLFSTPFIVVLTTSLTGFLWNFLFIPTKSSFQISGGEDWLILTCFVLVSLVIGLQTTRVKAKEKIVNLNDERISFMHFFTKNLFEVRGIQNIIQLTLEKITQHFQVEAGIILSDFKKGDQLSGFVMGGGVVLNEKEQSVAQWVLANGRSAGRFTDTLSSASGMYFPLNYRNVNHGVLCIIPKEIIFNSNQVSIFEDVSRHLGLVLERDIFEEKSRKFHIEQESRRIYSNLIKLVSHNLQTPLNEILEMFSGVNRDETIVKKNTLRMLDIIKNFVGLSQIEEGTVTLNKEFFDFSLIMEDILKYFVDNFSDKKIVCHFFPKKLPSAFLDKDLIHQAIKNIVQNACIYAPAGTTVQISVSKNEQNLDISIQDQGPGLPNHNPNIVFEKFYKKDNKTMEGAGIGLTVSKAIIELHQGSINAENLVEGSGALFRIHIPAFPLNT